MTSRSWHSITSRILTLKFVNEFMLIFPLYPIMFGERGGVDAAGIGVLLAAGTILTVCFEVPTGIIADKVSRKYVLLMAILARAACMAIWLAWPTFSGYLAGMAFLSLGLALESGALQAYLYGALGSDVQRSFGKFWSKVSAMTLLSWSLAYVVATLIGVRYDLLLALCIVVSLTALAICLTLPKDDIAASGTELKPKILRSAVRHILRTVELRTLLLTGLLVVALAYVTIYYIGPYYHAAGVETRWVPLLMAAGNLIGAAMFWTLHSWEWFLDKYKLLLGIVVTVLFVLSANGGVVALCAGFLLLARFLRILQIQFEAKVQHLANDEARATISSLASFVANLIAGILMLSVGLFAVDEDIRAPLQIILVAGVVVYAALHLLRLRPSAAKHI